MRIVFRLGKIQILWMKELDARETMILLTSAKLDTGLLNEETSFKLKFWELLH
jgi:hypothetical protein